jgi:mRNA-degrading endonuclease RelE of RelBE toxin-antitoxin system
MQETAAIKPVKVEWAPGAEMMLEQLPASEQARLRNSLDIALRDPDQSKVKLIGAGGQGRVWMLRETSGFRVFFQHVDDRVIVLDIARREQLDFFQSGNAYEKALARRRATRP